VVVQAARPSVATPAKRSSLTLITAHPRQQGSRGLYEDR
jgi:hypothetical protein